MYVCSKEYLLAGFYNQIVQEGSSVLLHALHRGGGVRGVRRGRGDCARQHRGREWQRAAVRGRGRGDRGERADHGAVRPPRHQDPGNLLETSCLVTPISPAISPPRFGWHRFQGPAYLLNCFKVSESNNSDVRGFLLSSWPLHNFFKWPVFRSIPPLTHHEFGKW